MSNRNRNRNAAPTSNVAPAADVAPTSTVSTDVAPAADNGAAADVAPAAVTVTFHLDHTHRGAGIYKQHADSRTSIWFGKSAFSGAPPATITITGIGIAVDAPKPAPAPTMTDAERAAVDELLARMRAAAPAA